MSSDYRRSGGKQPARQPASEPERTTANRQRQHPAAQSESSALGILADAALSGSGVGGTSAPQPQSNSLQAPAPAPAPEYLQPANTFIATLSLNTRLPSSQSTTLPPLLHLPSTRMPLFPASTTPARPADNAFPWECPRESNTQHPSSVSDTAAAFRGFGVTGLESIRTTPSTGTTTDTTSTRPANDGNTPAPSDQARKKKSSYFLDHMAKAGRIEKDNVILDKDRFNYFIYSRDKAAEVAAKAAKETEKKAMMANGKEKLAVQIDQESTRDLPEGKYLRMLEEPGQKSYEEAMLEVLDGLELPVKSGN